MKPKSIDIETQVASALAEDLADASDLTANLIDSSHTCRAQLIAKGSAILCGTDWFNEAFKQIDENINIRWFKSDGESLINNDVLCEITGRSRSVLTAERTALNFLQTLSSVSTRTHRIKELISAEGLKTEILDTRKTIPNLRAAQKYAVTCGGGNNHRLGLYDQLLIKENHIAACGSITSSIKKARIEYGDEVFVAIEVRNLDELKEALALDVNQILLDNFNDQIIGKAIILRDQINKNCALEVSGNITKKNIISYAKTGIDFISLGTITKNIKAIDFSLLIID